jgi:hypothetical protein
VTDPLECANDQSQSPFAIIDNSVPLETLKHVEQSVMINPCKQCCLSFGEKCSKVLQLVTFGMPWHWPNILHCKLLANHIVELGRLPLL